MGKFVKRRKVFPPDAYMVVAGIIRLIDDKAIRKKMADHFATEFNRRSAAFDPITWNRWTGGTPAPNSAYTSNGPPPRPQVQP